MRYLVTYCSGRTIELLPGETAVDGDDPIESIDRIDDPTSPTRRQFCTLCLRTATDYTTETYPDGAITRAELDETAARSGLLDLVASSRGGLPIVLAAKVYTAATADAVGGDVSRPLAGTAGIGEQLGRLSRIAELGLGALGDECDRCGSTFETSPAWRGSKCSGCTAADVAYSVSRSAGVR